MNRSRVSRTILAVEDGELAARVASGDVRALATFVDRYYTPIFRFLWHTSGSREDAEDLAAQTLLRARIDIRAFRSNGSLAAWVYRVARREFLQHRRRQVIASFFAGKLSNEKVSPPSEDLIVIQQALAQLPINQRTAFLLTEVEGLTTDEAAQALAVPPGTVKSRCHHARKRLRELLGPAFPEISNNAQPIAD